MALIALQDLQRKIKSPLGPFPLSPGPHSGGEEDTGPLPRFPEPSGLKKVQDALSSVPFSAYTARPLPRLGQVSESHDCVFYGYHARDQKPRWENPALG